MDSGLSRLFINGIGIALTLAQLECAEIEESGGCWLAIRATYRRRLVKTSSITAKMSTTPLMTCW